MISFSRRTVMSAMVGTALIPAGARACATATQRASFELEHREIFLRGLDPAHDGLRIAQLSDIHVGRRTPDGRVLAAVAAVNALAPDLVMMTGDFVTTNADPREKISELLSGIVAPTFSVLGNHDHWTNAAEVKTQLHRIGSTVLQNQHTTFRINGSDFTVLGMDDSTTRNDRVADTFRGAPTAGSRLVLTHTPTGADQLPENDDLFCLSGHTHGGQMHVPRVTEFFFKSFGRMPYLRGHYAVRGNQLYVNRGLGFGRGTAAPRIDSEPEVTLITLRRTPEARLG